MVEELVNYLSKWFLVSGDLDDFIFYEEEQPLISER